MVADIFAGISAFKTLYDSAKALKDMNDATVRNGAVIELQAQILAAQAAQMSLIDRVREAEEKVRSFETWEAEKQSYELKDLGWGALAYMLKPEMRGAKPPHWVCANCYGNDRISIIQYGQLPNLGMRHHCPACKAMLSPSGEALDGNKAKWLD